MPGAGCLRRGRRVQPLICSSEGMIVSGGVGRTASAVGTVVSSFVRASNLSRSSSSSLGRSAMEPKRKYFRKFLVVPYWTGLPGASFFPTSLMSSRSKKKAYHAVSRDSADRLDLCSSYWLRIGYYGKGLESGPREATLVLLAVAILQ